MAFIPRYYQIKAVDAIFDYYAAGKTGNPILALPTATGKSLIISEFIKRVMLRWPRQRIILLTHVKELLKQNSANLRAQWPDVPLGIFSAGLNQRDTALPIIYGGVASVANCVEKFGWRDLMIVDECHLISPKDDTLYQDIIKRLKVINPALKVIGLTATPYRMGQGLLTDGGIFTDVIFDLTGMKEFNRLIDEGYLCKLIPKRTIIELDVSNVGISQGDFQNAELQRAVDKDAITYAACKEIVEEGQHRNSWLIFASGIEHAEHIALMLQSFGVNAACVHSKMSHAMADKRIADFQAGKLRCIVNYGKLTTGFDHPPIDLIGMLRPTMSTGLWVQMLGRGTRPCEGKDNCLVLDFARNTPRLGPINDPVIPRKRVKGEQPGIAPVRICEVCGVYNHARATHCVACGAEFAKQSQLVPKAGNEELIRSGLPIVNTYPVTRVIYNRYQKEGSPPMIKISYICGLKMYHEWLCLEHGGYASHKARQWWRERMGTIEAPPTTDDALQYIQQCRVPKAIRVHDNKKYPEVLNYEF